LCRGYFIFQVKLFLFPLVLNQFNYMGLGKNFFAFLFQLSQSLRINMFYLNGEDVTGFSTVIHRVKISKLSLNKLMRNAFTACVLIRIKNMDINVIINCGFNYHSSKLPAI